jgi:1-acyl-sn-glycerol-3-phosphate acyltransferase
MFRTAIWFIWFWISLILSLPELLRAYILDKRGSLEKRVSVVHRTTGMWARSLVTLSGSRIKVTGQENIPAEGPVLYVSNHQSNFDVPILIGFIDRPKAFMSKMEVVKIPMVSSWMRQMRCVFMDRKDARQSVAAVNEAVQNLKRVIPWSFSLRVREAAEMRWANLRQEASSSL